MTIDLEEDFLENFPPYDIEELTKEDILSDLVIDYLVSIVNPAERMRKYEAVKDKARKFKITKSFTQMYNYKDNLMGAKNLEEKQNEGLQFPEMTGIIYKSNSYELDIENNSIFFDSGKSGKFLVCYHPILPIERYKNLENGTEKVKIGFYKDNKWNYVIVDKSIISSNQSIVKLSDLGVEVTSETAKFLVKYLSEIGNLNKDKIKINNSISRLGWLKDLFIPYSSNYSFMGSQDFTNIFNSVNEFGNYQKWKNTMKELRCKSITLRFLMASSFASPLIELLHINPFIVHLWGKSETGKTVAQMICASIWGNPKKGKLLNTLDNTDTALETLCNFLHNIPVILDEFQLIKGKYPSYDSIVYKLTEGKGKGRSNTNLGLEESLEWNNIFILSGEEPITTSSSKEGVKNRVIEIEENNKMFENGREIVDIINSNYGFAGKDFINLIPNKESLIEEYHNLMNNLKSYCKYEKQLNAIAIILIADKIVSTKIFDDIPITIEEVKRYFHNDTDEADRYFNLILDIANSHINYFCVDDEKPSIANSEIWGKIVQDGIEIKYYDFIPRKLIDTLNLYNINWDGIKTKLKNKGYIVVSSKAKEYTINTRINKVQQRVIRIKNPNYFKNNSMIRK